MSKHAPVQQPGLAPAWPGGLAPAPGAMVRFDATKTATASAILGTDDDPTAPTPAPPSTVRASDVPVEARCVDSMPLDIQRGFRHKMMGLLVVQLMVMLVGGAALVALDVGVSQNTFSLLFLGMATILLALWTLKNVYPLNYVLYTLFTLVGAVFVGGGNAYFRSGANFQILGYTTVNTFVMFLLCTRTAKNQFGEDQLPEWGDVYKKAFVVMLATALGVQVGVAPGTWGHALSSVMFSSFFTFWFRYDAEKMCAVLSPDDYMAGFLSMWADFFSVLAVCATLMCLCGSGGDGGGDVGGIADASSATV